MRSVLAALTLAVLVLAPGACSSGSGDASPAPPTGSAPPTATSSPSSTGVIEDDPAAYAAELIRETNAARGEEGLPELGSSRCAQSAALERSADLVGAGTLAHAPLAGVIKDCAPATTAAENLSKADAAPRDVLDAWLESPGHRSNLLDPDLTEIGIGCTRDGDVMVCSQVFLGP